MGIEITKELAALQRMSVAAPREKYAEVFGEATTTGNRTWLRRIAWRIRALAEGDLSERARQRAALLRELADFGVTITSRANETFGASSDRDDLVLAVALAVWSTGVESTG